MQYIKIAKELKKNLSHREFILYGMIAAYLSIPNFEATHGGFKKMMYTRTRDGHFKLDNAWRGLQEKGYLKMIRMPLDHNTFYYRYELLSKPQKNIPAKRTLCLEEGRRYLNNCPPIYTEPTQNYYTISRTVLLDPQLSFSEKWIWMIAQNYLEMYEQGILKDKDGSALDFVRKTALRSATGICSTKFDRHWRNLKVCGYLHTSRFYDTVNGVTRFEYAFSADPFATPALQKEHSKMGKMSENTPIITEKATEIPRDPRIVKQIIRENIRYEDLVAQSRLIHEDGFFYSKGRLDAIVDLMVSVFCTKKATVRVNGENTYTDIVRSRIMALDYEHILYGVLYKLWEYGEEDITNVRAYRLTVLYNAIESI